MWLVKILNYVYTHTYGLHFILWHSVELQDSGEKQHSATPGLSSVPLVQILSW